MGRPPISKIAKGFRLHPSLRNEANNIDSLSQMQAKKIKKNHVWLFWFFVAELPQPPGGGKVKSAIARPGQPTKKKRPSAQCREAMEYVLRLQKSAPFPTRQWLHVLCFYFRCKNSFSGHDKVKPIHPSTKRHANGVIRSHLTPSLFQKSTCSPSEFHPEGSRKFQTFDFTPPSQTTIRRHWSNQTP